MPFVLIVPLLFLPLAWLFSLISSTGGLIVILVALSIGFLLQSGTPPIYALIVLFLTTIMPVGVPSLMIAVDEEGKVSLLTPDAVEESYDSRDINEQVC